MFSSIKKRFVAAAKFLVEATKNSFVVPNFVAVTKPFFPCLLSNSSKYNDCSQQIELMQPISKIFEVTKLNLSK